MHRLKVNQADVDSTVQRILIRVKFAIEIGIYWTILFALAYVVFSGRKYIFCLFHMVSMKIDPERSFTIRNLER